MGSWSLLSNTLETSDHDTKELYGTNVMVTVKLKYTPQFTYQKKHRGFFKNTWVDMDVFKEPPHLKWWERIIMKEVTTTPLADDIQTNKTYWEYAGNQYDRNPLSKTLEVYCKRYVRAFSNAAGEQQDALKGDCVLLKDNGRPVSFNRSVRTIQDKVKRAEYVRDYLSKNGGILKITIHDIPSINVKSKETKAKERLLLFECGIEGMTPTIKLEQHLKVDTNDQFPSDETKAGWTRNVNRDWSTYNDSWKNADLQLNHFTKAPAPSSVALKKNPVFFSGECW